MDNRITRQDLKIAFDAMIRVLSAVRNVTGPMLVFDGSADDIERFGYFYDEGLTQRHQDSEEFLVVWDRSSVGRR